ncbi:hypothetical protein TRVL_03006 [Trypanosoma vivax]|nr:hypothetical protein TRVL_03006 [Trypanosoma vivax]
MARAKTAGQEANTFSSGRVQQQRIHMCAIGDAATLWGQIDRALRCRDLVFQHGGEKNFERSARDDSRREERRGRSTGKILVFLAICVAMRKARARSRQVVVCVEGRGL